MWDVSLLAVARVGRRLVLIERARRRAGRRFQIAQGDIERIPLGTMTRRTGGLAETSRSALDCPWRDVSPEHPRQTRGRLRLRHAALETCEQFFVLLRRPRPIHDVTSGRA